MTDQLRVDVPQVFLSEGYCRALEEYLENAICSDTFCIYRTGCPIYNKGKAALCVSSE